MKLTEENHNDTARKSQRNDFVESLNDKSLSPMISHTNNIVESQMHNCMVDEREVNKDTFQVILTVEYIRD
jgi:hypothetical protein